jgi:ribonucleoside-diphosphate reductase alpha chain
MCRRVAKCIAGAETDPEKALHYEAKFYNLLDRLLFLPNTPTLVNAGRPNGQLSACFVLPVEDSIESIFEAIKQTAIIQKSGGGTGFDFSRIREQNQVVRSTGRQASGPLSFMQAFDAGTETIKQGGVRRGANMALLRCDHPNILQFINAKSEEGVYKNFNFSVAITDKFIQALENDELFELVSPLDGQVKRRIKATEIMQAIVEKAWSNGEPGVVFIDTINKDNPIKSMEIQAVNPCSEQPLNSYESCVLGSVNLSRHLSAQEINLTALEETVRTAIRFLDNCIDANHFPLPQIEAATKANRKIGLGVMGWADLLLLLDIKYDSQEALSLVDQIMGQLYLWADDESRSIAREKGGFPNASLADNDIQDRRNASLTTIAPTGSISILAGCSSGIEPIFSYAQAAKRAIISDALVDLNPVVAAYCHTQGIDLSDYNLKSQSLEMARQEVSRLNLYLKTVLPNYFVTAKEVSGDMHVRMQAAFQKYTDSGISKTVNLPNSATKKDVEDIYRLAYQLGCFPAGHTIYTSSGLKDISKIKTGDTVYGMDGQLHKVKETYVREHSQLLYHIKATGMEDVTCTEEHPFLVVTKAPDWKYKAWTNQSLQLVWKEAKDLIEGDHVVTVFLTGQEQQITSIALTDYLADLPNWEVRNDKVYSIKPLPWKPEVMQQTSRSNTIPAILPLTEEIGELIGWYLAEGHVDKRGYVKFTVGTHEEHVLNQLDQILRQYFGLESQRETINSNGGTSRRLTVGCRLFANFMKNLCGTGARKKHLPSWFLNCSRSILSQIVEAWFKGDGGVTISRELMRGMFAAMLACGQIPKLKLNYGQGYTLSKANGIFSAKPFQGYQAYKVKAIRRIVPPEPVKVYNFAVADVDTYMVNGIVVHNCKGVTVYRDGSRNEQVIYTTAKTVKGSDLNGYQKIWERPRRTKGESLQVKLENGKTAYVTVTLDDQNRPREVFANSLEDLEKPWLDEAIFRLVSIGLRGNIHPKTLVKQLLAANTKGNMFTTLAIAARALEEVAGLNTEEGYCPQCGGIIRRESGCVSCPCGFSDKC